MSKIGEQVMDCRGLNLKTNAWEIVEPKKCLCCKSPTVFLEHDSARNRILFCESCTALEIITKGSPAWWYHGARLPKDWPASFLKMARE